MAEQKITPDKMSADEMLSPDGSPVVDTSSKTITRAEVKGSEGAVTSMKDSPVVKEGEDTPTEVEEGTDINDFLKVTDKVGEALGTKVDDKREVIKKEELSTKPDEKAAPTLAKDSKVQDKTVVKDTPVAKEVESRDYSAIEESLQPAFKRMSNEAFNAILPIYKERNELKKTIEPLRAKLTKLESGAIPESYESHPLAYALTPEFSEASNTATKAQQILNHWKGQAERIRAGETTFTGIEIDPRTGGLYETQPMQVTKQSEDYVNRAIDHSQQQFIDRQYKIKSIGENYNNKYQSAIKELRDFESTSFSNFSKDDPTVTALIKDTVEKVLPPQFHSNPLASLLAKSLLTIQALGNTLKQAKAAPIEEVKTKTATEALETKAKKNPTLSDMSGGGGGSKNGNGDDVTIDDFKAVKEEW